MITHRPHRAQLQLNINPAIPIEFSTLSRYRHPSSSSAPCRPTPCDTLTSASSLRPYSASSQGFTSAHSKLPSHSSVCRYSFIVRKRNFGMSLSR